MNRDEIIQVNDSKVEAVQCEEWGGTVHIKSLSGRERRTLEIDISKDAKSDGPAIARVVCMCLCDDKGTALFAYPQDIDVLETKSITVLQRIFSAALKLNAFTKKDVDELAGN